MSFSIVMRSIPVNTLRLYLVLFVTCCVMISSSLIIDSLHFVRLLLFRYSTGTLTSVFLDRVFQECLTYDGEMDYKTYLDFVLAMENRKEPQALQYLFRLLDVQNKGCINIFDLNFFFRVCITKDSLSGFVF